MPGSTNIKPWDPNLSNLETDAAYLADAMRLGGAQPGIFPKETFNKLAFQLSAFVSALSEAMAAKGYVVEDGSAGSSGHDHNALVTVLANLMTAVDVVPFANHANVADSATVANAAINASGAGTAVYSPEVGLKVVRGTIAANGTIYAGTGFTVVRDVAGQYTITFTQAFSALTSANVTALDLGGYNWYKAVLISRSQNQIRVNTYANGPQSDAIFDFIVIGPK